MSSSSHANDFVADTMALILRIEGRRLGPAAKAAFEAMESGQGTIWVPAVVYAEILYLSEKQRIQITLTEVAYYQSQFPNCREHPLTFSVVQAAASIHDVRELHDRLIAAVARSLQVTLLTNDPIIQASQWVTTAWK